MFYLYSVKWKLIQIIVMNEFRNIINYLNVFNLSLLISNTKVHDNFIHIQLMFINYGIFIQMLYLDL
jgi:hypothetical protein